MGASRRDRNTCIELIKVQFNEIMRFDCGDTVPPLTCVCETDAGSDEAKSVYGTWILNTFSANLSFGLVTINLTE